jgi:Zn-finger nucleic acid-binding protein
MKCPRTGKELKPVTIGGIEIDLSMGCGGVWFDQLELEHFDEVHEEAGTLLVQHMKDHHKPLENSGVRLKCPKDTDVVMMRRYYSPVQQIEIDECPQCGGIWLDTEELSGIRDLFPTQEQREEAGKKFVDNMMNSPEVKEHQSDVKMLSDKLEKVTNVLWSIIGVGKK